MKITVTWFGLLIRRTFTHPEEFHYEFWRLRYLPTSLLREGFYSYYGQNDEKYWYWKRIIGKFYWRTGNFIKSGAET